MSDDFCEACRLDGGEHWNWCPTVYPAPEPIRTSSTGDES